MRAKRAFRLIAMGAVALSVLSGSVRGQLPSPPCVSRDNAAQLSPPVPVPAITTGGNRLTLEFRDFDNGELIPVRAAVFRSSGWHAPLYDPEGHVFQQRIEQSYFYCDGTADVMVDNDQVKIHAGRGFEYEPVATSLQVNSDMTHVMYLRRWIDMAARGWYSGDTHVHILHGPANYSIDATTEMMMMRAEDLNFINSLEDESLFTGDVYAGSDPTRILYFSKEQRNAHYSHLSVLGLEEWITDSGCAPPPSLVCGYRLDEELADELHAQSDNVVVIATHPFPTLDLDDTSPWPGGGVWRAMPLDLAAGVIDAVDILAYTHESPPEGIDDYFHALNLGYRLPSSVGSDAGLATGFTKPPGGYRVYVMPDEQFSFEAWVEAFRGGRSFVSNYPLITYFELAGVGPGGIATHRGEKLRGGISVECLFPMEKVEIIGNDKVLTEVRPAPGGDGRKIEGSFAVDPNGVTWVVARVTGEAASWHLMDANGLFAQTSPVYLELSRGDSGAPSQTTPGPFFAARGAASQRFLNVIDALEDVYTAHGYFPSNSRPAYAASVAHARETFLRIHPDPPRPVIITQPRPAIDSAGRALVDTPTPTFTWTSSSDPDPGDRVRYELSISESPDFIPSTQFNGLTDTSLTITPESALRGHTVYYWRVRAVDDYGLFAGSVPAQVSIYTTFDPVATDAPDGGAPARWAISSLWPNPFNPTLRVEYVVENEAEPFSLAVFSARGALVRTLETGVRPPGAHQAVWDGRDRQGRRVASGVYFVRLTVGYATVATRKAVLTK